MTVANDNMEDLARYPDGSFDVATCCYGYMFPADKTRALSETLRVLKPGGHLVATTWDRLPMLLLLKDVMTDVLGAAPPPPPINPMALAEPGLFESMVTQAGFVDLQVSHSTYCFNFGAERRLQSRLGLLLVKDKLQELGAWDRGEQAFWRHVPKYSRQEADGRLVLPDATFKLTVAAKP